MRFHAYTSPTNEQTILNTNLKPALLALATLCAAAPAFAAEKVAKDYPNKPIRVIVPSPAGGPPDLVMRMLLPYYIASMGQTLVIDNRSGAGGVVGSATVAKGVPDGYTWLLTTASHTNTPPFSKNVPFDPVKDFSHVTLVAQNFGQALAVPTNSPAKSVADLIALAKAKPGKLNYASAGIGTASHIPAEVMKSMAGVDIVGVQYKGVPEAMTDTIAGRMDLVFVGTQIALPLLQSNRLRVLALTGAKRWKGMPDVPTMQESGFKGYNLINWFGLWLPPGASPALLARLHAETVKALAAPEVLKQFDAQGLEGVGLPPAEFLKFVTTQSAFMNELARKIDAGAK
jgi:tripartite-type tricarboxylate transporter receptor subunit TctC